MDVDQKNTNQYLFYIVAIIVIGFMIYLWYTGKNKHISLDYQKYPINNREIIESNNIYRKNDISSKNDILSKNNRQFIVNTESMTLGSHNSAHGSPIIASPYN